MINQATSSSKAKKVLLLLTAFALIFSLLFTTACGKDPTETTTESSLSDDGTEANTQAVNNTNPVDDSTTAPAGGEVVTTPDGKLVTDSSGNTVTTPPPPTNAATQPTAATANNKQAILNEYKKILDQAKKDKPTHKSNDYQEIQNRSSFSAAQLGVVDKHLYKGEGSESLISEKIVDTRTLETKAQSKVSENKHPASPRADYPDNMRWFAVSCSIYGCLLTDASKLKNATKVDNGNGTTTITLTLIDEESPKSMPIVRDDERNATKKYAETTAPSAHAGIMNVPEISSVLKYSRIIGFSGKVKFSGSTSTLTYNTATGHVISLYQIGKANVTIDGSIKKVEFDNAQAKLWAFYDFYDFVY